MTRVPSLDFGRVYPHWPKIAIILVPAAIAALTRLLGYNSTGLWLDEAWRANFILDPAWFINQFDGSSFATITSFVYAVIVRVLNFAYASSWLLRLTSLLPGIAAVVLLVPVVSRLTRSSALGLAAGLAAALNVTLIQYSKELKPYALELFMHVAMIYAALRYMDQPAPGKALRWVVLAAAPIASLTAANSVFIIPGFYLAIAYTQWKRDKRIHLETICSAAVTALLLVLQYKFVWFHDGQSGLEGYWAANFYTEGDRLAWLIASLKDMVHASFDMAYSPTVRASLGGVSPSLFDHLKLAFDSALPFLALAGALTAFLSWRRPEIALLVALPIFGVILANQLKIWPLGAIRPNVFLYGYFILIVCVGLGGLARLPIFGRFSRWTSLALATPMLFWFGIVGFPSDFSIYKTFGPPREEASLALNAVYDQVKTSCGSDDLILTNTFASIPVRYYLTFDTDFRRDVGDPLQKCARIEYGTVEVYNDAAAFRAMVEKAVSERPNVWFVWTHLGEPEITMMKAAAAPYGAVASEADVGGAGFFYLKKAASPPPKASPVSRNKAR